MRRRWMVLLVGLLAACNLAVPEVTPTLAPTRTPSPTRPATDTPIPTLIAQVASETPSATVTPSDTPTATRTLSPTPSRTPTATATLTATQTNPPTNTPTDRPTATPSATLTPTPTATFTATNTDAPTATQTDRPTRTPSPTLTSTPPPTATNTRIPTVTPLPLLPTDTPRPTATLTFTPSITVPPTLTPLPTLTNTPSLTPAPTVTPTRTLTAAEMAAFETLRATQQTLTPVIPTLPPPTLDVTPTFITAEAPATIPAEITPLAVTTTLEIALETATPQPTVALRVTLAPLVTAAPPLPVFQPPNLETRAFVLSAEGVGGVGINLLNDTTLFARNPVDPNLYVTTNSAGTLFLTELNGADAYRPDMSPFSQFEAPSRDENPAFVSAVAWSPDGRYLAFIVNGDKLANDGVWFFQPGQFPPIQLLVDCPTPGFPGCSIVSNPFSPDLWESRSLRWSPGSDALLVNLWLPGEGRDGLIVLPDTRNERARDTRPNVYRYDYGVWSRDGGLILVSGRAEDGHVLVGWINRDGSYVGTIFDAEVSGLWMGYANQSRDGTIYALGAPGDRGGAGEPLRIYNMAGQPLTPPIGEGATPQRVEWSPDGNAVFVQVNGRQYIADAGGGIREITGQVAGARAINWVNGALPQGDSFSPPAGAVIVPVGATAVPSIPLGVVVGSVYQPGQQLRVYVTQLNVRGGPGTGYDFVRNFLTTGEYVAILAGPVVADGAIWWQVQTADGIVGWVAGEINGAVTLGP